MLTVKTLIDSISQVIIDAEKAEASRLSALVAAMQETDFATFKTISKEAAQASGLKTRISEARQIFGATKFNLINVTECGWKTAATRSRDALKENGIKWDGTPIEEKTEAEKQQAANNALRKQAEKELHDQGIILDVTSDDSIMAWGGRLRDKMEQIKAAKQRELMEKKQGKIPEVVENILAQGLDYAAEFLQVLMAEIAAKNSSLVYDAMDSLEVQQAA